MQIDQVNRRYILVRALAALGCLIVLQQCATKLPAADIARIKTVGVVSFAGGKFVMASVRPIVAGIRTTNEIADWGVDEIIVEEATKALMPRFNVLPVTYDRGGLWKDFETMRSSSGILPPLGLARSYVWPAATISSRKCVSSESHRPVLCPLRFVASLVATARILAMRGA